MNMVTEPYDRYDIAKVHPAVTVITLGVRYMTPLISVS